MGNDPAFLIVNNKIHKNIEKNFFTTDEFEPKIKINEKRKQS